MATTRLHVGEAKKNTTNNHSPERGIFYGRKRKRQHMKVTPEKVGVTIPMADKEHDWAQVRADEWRVEHTEGFRSLVKAMEERPWLLT